MASGLVPDVMLMGVGWVEAFAENGVMADLGSLGLTADELSTTTNSKVVDAGVYDGNLYAAPIMLGGVTGVARMDLLAEAGFDHPPTTVPELRDMAKALTVRDASGTMTRAGFDVQSIDPRQVFETVLFSQGGKLFNSDNTKPEFNSPAGVSALQLMTNLFLTDKVEDVGFSSTDATVNPLITGAPPWGSPLAAYGARPRQLTRRCSPTSSRSSSPVTTRACSLAAPSRRCRANRRAPRQPRRCSSQGL